MALVRGTTSALGTVLVLGGGTLLVTGVLTNVAKTIVNVRQVCFA